MANYNLTNQTISSSFQQLLQKDVSTGTVYDGTGSVVSELDITSSYALTASYAENVTPIDTGSFATTGSNSFIGQQEITNIGANAIVALGDISQPIGDYNNVSGRIVAGGYGKIDGTSTYTGSFLGDGSGLTNVTADNATNADNIALTADNTNTNRYVPFTATANGDGALLTDAGLLYNAFSNTLTTTTFNGDLSGNASTATTADSATSASHAEVADLALNSTNSTYAQNTITTGKNVSGAPISKGTPLYFTGSGTQGNLVGVWPADAGNPARMPAGGIAGEALSAGAEGVVLLDGYIGGVDTSLFASGDTIYVAVGGGYTNTAPTGSSNFVQFLGTVEKSDANGSGVVQMQGESRQLPNIQTGYAWVGNGDGVPQAVSTASWDSHSDLTSLNAFTASQEILNATFATTGSNNFIGDQTFTGNTRTTGQISGSSVQIQGTALNSIANESTSPALVLNVGDSSGSILELVNQGATGIFGYGAKFSRNVDILGTLDVITTGGGHNFVNTNAGADLIMTIGDGSGLAVEIVNSAASSIFGYGIKFSRDVDINGLLEVFDNTTISGSLDVQSTLTASLQEGYVWAGGAGNVSTLVATSSFGGGGGGIFEQTGSFYATTNDLQITGSLGVTKAIGGKVTTLSITSNTASIDLTDSNTYELTLVSSADTHLDVSTFGEDAQSINILVKQPAAGNTGSISFSPDFKFGQGYSYIPTPSNSSEDMISFLRVGSYLYGTYINNFS